MHRRDLFIAHCAAERDEFIDSSAQSGLNCFPAYRTDGKPSHLRVLRPAHPLAAGLPATFTLPRTEMYDEPFHVPEPDEVIVEERWDSGEWFRSVMVWRLGTGRVIYIRPGRETYPIFKDPHILRLVDNAVRWRE